jgi:hypothetical protein
MLFSAFARGKECGEKGRRGERRGVYISVAESFRYANVYIAMHIIINSSTVDAYTNVSPAS